MTKGRKYHEQASRPRNIGNRTIIHKKRPPSDESGRFQSGRPYQSIRLVVQSLGSTFRSIDTLGALPPKKPALALELNLPVWKTKVFGSPLAE